MQGDAANLAQAHWNEKPLYLMPEDRYKMYPWLYEAAEFRRHAGERVLEIGCGTGLDLLQFALHGAIATGVEITEEHIKLATERVAGKAEVRRADARELPFPDGSFDYVYSHGVIHHSDEPARCIAELMRVLKSGGRFNVQVYAKWSYIPPMLMLRFKREWRNHIEASTRPVHIDLYTGRRLKKLFPVPAQIRKYHCGRIQKLAPLMGWYLVATGTK